MLLTEQAPKAKIFMEFDNGLCDLEHFEINEGESIESIEERFWNRCKVRHEKLNQKMPTEIKVDEIV